ncbi:uncharacterized protein [Haliotis asinina]|uniref:uncharacterized protein n=1 Tax=Haliotis asinina TaxID=109174 RepID=UPI003532497E
MASQTDNPGSRLDNIAKSTQLLIHHDDPSRFVSTFAERSALKILKSFGSVFIKGKSGSGKSRIGLKILDDISKEKGVQPLILTSCTEWKLVPQTEGKYVVMLDNIFGSSSLVQTRVDEWSRLFDIMWPAVESGHIYLIVTSRPEISAQCESQVKKYKLINNIKCITLDSGPYALRHGEKKKLMRMYCGKLTISDEEIRKAVEVDGALGFPQCCKYYASSSKAKAKGIQFFFKPYEYITEEIEILQESDPLGYMVLLLVMMNGGHLPNTPMRSPKKTQQIETLIESGLCNPTSPPSSRAIQVKAESLCDVYLENIDNKFQFHHQSIFDALFAFVSRVYPHMFLGICPAKLLVEMVKTQIHGTKSNEVVVMVPEDSYGVLADRITEVLLSEDTLVVLDHPALHDEEFTDVMFERWKGEKKLMDILTFVMPHELEIEIGQRVDGCLFECKFILPCMLLKQIGNLADLLTTVLKDDSPTVMLTELLACAVYMNDFTSANMLLNMGVTPDESCFRALCGSPYTSNSTDGVAKHILSAVTENMELQDMFCAAVFKDNSLVVQHLFDSKFKKREMTILNKWLDRLCFLLSNMGENIIDMSHSNRTMEDITEKMIETACMPDPEFLLWMAATHRVSVIMKHLLRMDLDVNEEFFNSKPLYQALSFGVAHNVALLLEHGVDISKTKDNRVLHLAAKSNFQSEQKTYILCSYLESLQGDITSPQEHSNDPEDVGDSENPDDQREWVDHEDQRDTQDQEDGDTQGDESSEMQEDVGEQGNDALLEYFLNTQYKGKMPVHSACSADNAGSLGVLMQAGADVNARTSQKSTSLHIAVEKGSVECVKLLLRANASVNVIDADNNTPLTCSDKTHYEIVKALVYAGADVNFSGCSGRTCLHLALQNDDLDTVRLLCDHGADVNTVETEGVTVLMKAALHGEIHMMKLLCEKGATLESRDEKGETVLHKAAISSIDAAEKLLYLFGLRRAPVDTEDNAGRTALFPGVQSEDVEVIQIIRDKGFDLLKCDRDGNNALHAACKAGVEDFDTIYTLFGNSFGHINQQNNDGETVLYLLVHGNISCDFKQLLDGGANPNIASANGRTVLHVAVEKKKFELVELLLQRDGDSRVADETGMTPLHIASQSGNCQIVRLLLKHGAAPNAVNENGRTSIHLASENLYKDCVQELLKEGADPCAMDNKGLTPLHICVGVNIAMEALKRKMMYPFIGPYGIPLESVEKSTTQLRHCIMKMLLDAGANPNVSDNEGKSILYVASTEQSAETSVKILLEAGGDISTTDPDGRSLLHFVAESGKPEAYRLLVDSGADEYARDHSGRTPLQIMTKRERKSKVPYVPNFSTIMGNLGFPLPFSQPNPLGAFANTSGFGQSFSSATYRPSHREAEAERGDRSELKSKEDGDQTIVYQRDESIGSGSD